MLNQRNDTDCAQLAIAQQGELTLRVHWENQRFPIAPDRVFAGGRRNSPDAPCDTPAQCVAQESSTVFGGQFLTRKNYLGKNFPRRDRTVDLRKHDRFLLGVPAHALRRGRDLAMLAPSVQ